MHWEEYKAREAINPSLAQYLSFWWTMAPQLHILSPYLIDLDWVFYLSCLTHRFLKPGKLWWKPLERLFAAVFFISFLCLEFAIFCLSLILSDSCTRKGNEHKILVYVCYTLWFHRLFYSLVQSPLFRLQMPGLFNHFRCRNHLVPLSS